jgi:hypothetical protein
MGRHLLTPPVAYLPVAQAKTMGSISPTGLPRTSIQAVLSLSDRWAGRRLLSGHGEKWV